MLVHILCAVTVFLKMEIKMILFFNSVVILEDLKKKS